MSEIPQAIDLFLKIEVAISEWQHGCFTPVRDLKHIWEEVKSEVDLVSKTIYKFVEKRPNRWDDFCYRVHQSCFGYAGASLKKSTWDLSASSQWEEFSGVLEVPQESDEE
jgi:hypothetical protein